MNLTNDQILILGCTIFNLLYGLTWLVFGIKASQDRSKCTECIRDSSNSIVCKRCKHYKSSLAYYVLKHPKRIAKIGIKDNYNKKEK